MRQCIILNPGAGTADEIVAFESRLRDRPSWELVKTQGPGDATRMAMEAVDAGFERVVAAGGDGTLNEVLNGIAAALDRVELGLLPVGTGNDFARSVGIPTDLDKATSLLELGRVLPIDVVRLEAAGTRYFVNASAGGFSAVVSERMDARTKDWWGALAYSWTALKTLPELKEYRMHLRIDGGAPEEIAGYNVVIANARHIAGGIPIAPRAQLDDGLLDVLIVPVMPLSRATVVLPQILMGKHQDSEDLSFRRGSCIEIESDPEILLNTDGELAASSPARFEVLHRRLRFVIGELATPE